MFEQDRKVMFEHQGKKRFGIVAGVFRRNNNHLYIVKLDKKIKDYPYECVGVYGHAIVPMEDEDAKLESYEVETRRGGCIS